MGWDLGELTRQLDAALEDGLEDAMEAECERCDRVYPDDPDDLTISNLIVELLDRPDWSRELTDYYFRGEFDLKKLATEIGVDEFKRVAATL